MENLGLQLPKELDLIIDDGLHSPYANLASLIFGLPKIKVGGWIVLEDISSSTLPLWQLVACLISPNYSSSIYQLEGEGTETGGYIFAVHRLS